MYPPTFIVPILEIGSKHKSPLIKIPFFTTNINLSSFIEFRRNYLWNKNTKQNFLHTLLLTATCLDTFKWLKSKVPDSPGENGTFSDFFVWAKSHHLSSWATLLLTLSRLDVSKMSYDFLATNGRTDERTQIDEKKMKISTWHISAPCRRISKIFFLKWPGGPGEHDGMSLSSIGPVELSIWPLV